MRRRRGAPSQPTPGGLPGTAALGPPGRPGRFEGARRGPTASLRQRPSTARGARVTDRSPLAVPHRADSPVGQLLLGAGIVLLAFAAYAPALTGSFVFDDDVFVRNSALVRGPLRAIWFTRSSPDYWPLTSTVFWLEWRVFGDHTLGYHATSIALHAATAVLLWRALRSLGVAGAWLGAALFAVHPVAVESVAWISELKNTLSGFFFMASLLAWEGWDGDKRGPCLGVSLASFALALLAKASVAPLPIVLAGVSWARRRTLESRAAWALVPFFALALAGGLVTVWFQHTNALSSVWLPSRGWAERLGEAGWALAYYWRTAFLPVGLAVVHAPWDVGMGSFLFFAPLLFEAAVFASLWWQRRRAWQLLAALAFHAVMVLPVLGLVDIAYLSVGPVSNHLQYLALCGPAAFVGWTGAQALQRWPRASTVGLSALVLGFALSTARRSLAFEDELSLWTEAVRAAPGSAFAHHQLATCLADRGRAAEALGELEAMMRVERDPAARHEARSMWLLAAGRADEAAAEGQEAVRMRPDPGYRRVLGVALLRAGRTSQAVAVLGALVQDHPDSEARYWLAAALSREGRFAEAVEQLRQASAAAPEDAKLKEALSAVLHQIDAGRAAPAP